MLKKEFQKISVIIPTYNMGLFLRECLTTIKKQDYPNTEVIVVDGGSTDSTLDILGQYEDLVTRVLCQKDKGQSEAVTKGLLLATGEIIHWHAADDIVLPGAFDRVAAEFSHQKDLDLVFSDGLGFTADMITRGPTVRWVNFLDTLLFFGRFQSDCAYWRRPIMYDALPVDDDKPLTCDEDFFLRMWVGHRFKWINQPLGAFRSHSHQLSKRLDRTTVNCQREDTRRQIFERLGWSESRIRGMRAKRALSYWCLNRVATKAYSGMRFVLRKASGDILRKRYTRFLLKEWVIPSQE
jgi:glycosyltransferase involved in cell wall biosynthesis